MEEFHSPSVIDHVLEDYDPNPLSGLESGYLTSILREGACARSETNKAKSIPLVLHSEEQWYAMREIITDLYIRKGESLAMVAAIMESTYQFRAR